MVSRRRSNRRYDKTHSLGGCTTIVRHFRKNLNHQFQVTAKTRSGTLISSLPFMQSAMTMRLFDMKVIQAARFSGLIFLVATTFAIFATRTGYRIVGVTLPRQVWLVEHPTLWAAGNWLWMLAIFSWMLVLVALMWSYSPAHRISSMLQSGLLIIAAVLLIAGVVVWMNVLPYGSRTAQRRRPDPPYRLAGSRPVWSRALHGAALSRHGLAST